ncbi:pectate lyase-like protein [Rhodobacter aestuarii]|uniref:Pectate lyase superfamily protein n=1 Tax=Rhodobacter aestuarii TaxID=453582 RepID=A0A1N7P4S1_9RHOB|nr:glycosyl hydrolase family 28-related protein [Rhodobacter aestuarii]PTV97570.1 pectate lyase-like protein [Rhodobacter aestuarii]SIT05419.1 Pectate lyase superfamily protein [Rhodobacter aestuarii]
MNIAITDGVTLMPPLFEAGLDHWSSENGTAGSATYAGAANAALVAADANFGSCLEMVKTQTTQKLRYMGQTPILPGVYLRITAKVKAVSGNLCSVRIAGYAMSASGTHVSGLDEVGPSVDLTAYGRVETVSAIVGTGARGGVDMNWGTGVAYGHFGLDLTGLNNGVVRIEDIEIEDITEAFLREMMDWVDVRDFGAVGDGVTNDRAAFAAADAAAAGRAILVPEGSYYIGSSLFLNAPMRFVGTLVMPDAARLALAGSFDFPTYARAFGDEELALKKGIQALLGYTDHNSFDLCGRRVELSGPIDVAAICPDVTSFANRRVITNGQINVIEDPAWVSSVVTSQATYNSAQAYQLTGVANISNIPVGARISGTGVGREVYVRARNVGAGSLTLSEPLYGGSGTRTLTFTRDRYIFDFSGFDALSRFTLDNIEFLCNGWASVVMLAPNGENFQMRDCWVVRPKDRVISSPGRGCQNLTVDRCNVLSNEMSVPAQDRTSVALNVNANDAKIRESVFVRFGLTMIFNGSGHLIIGNHWFQGDDESNATRLPGLVFAQTNVQSAVTGNYIDDNIIEWTNEYDATPDLGTDYSFGGLTVTGNTFVHINCAPWVTWFSVKPYGTGHFVHGLSVTGNVFKSLNGAIDRIEKVDTSFATLDYWRMRNVVFENNMFNAVNQITVNPVFVQTTVASVQAVWTVDAAAYLPFGGWARNVESLVAVGAVTNGANARVTAMPYVTVEQGANHDLVTVTWPEAAKGKINTVIRMDTPN